MYFKVTLSRYEHSTREPKSETLNQLSDYLNVSIDYLFAKRKKEVEYLINKYNTNNPFDLMTCLKIELIKAPLEDGLNGCYFEKDNQQKIIINSNLDYDQQIMVASHELEHSVLHRGFNIL